MNYFFPTRDNDSDDEGSDMGGKGDATLEKIPDKKEHSGNQDEAVTEEDFPPGWCRLSGRIAKWIQDRGFGFITPTKEFLKA